MITASIKTTRTKIIGTLCVILAVVIGFILFFGGERTQNAEESISRRVLDNKARREYLALKGIQTALEPCKIKEVLLPEGDPVFDEYCRMQEDAGYDIGKYLGKTAEVFVYPVEDEEETFATVFVFEGKIIAADVANHIDGTQKAVD